MLKRLASLLAAVWLCVAAPASADPASNFALLPLISAQVTTSQSGDGLAQIGFQAGSPPTPIDLTGITFDLQWHPVSGGAVNATAVSLAAGQYLSNGGPTGVLTLSIPRSRLRTLAAGTYVASLTASLSGATSDLGVITITHSVIGSSNVTALSTSPRNAATATSIGYVPGPQGQSAYQVAVSNGFTGTLSQWLASLVGATGPPGTSYSFGTTAGTVAAGNDSRIVGATQNAAAAITGGTISGAAIGNATVPSRLGSITRTLANKFLDLPVTPLDQGAQCGSVVDATPALIALDAAGIPITLPDSCVLQISTAATINVPVTGRRGGVLNVNGVTLTLAGGYSGPLKPAFLLVNFGRVLFDPKTQDEARPEWFDNGDSDWLPEIKAAETSGAPRLQFAARDYHIASGWIASTSLIEIAGIGNSVAANPAASGRTRIILDSATGDTLTVGTLTAPVNNSFAVSGQRIHDIQVSRSVGPACNGPTSAATDPTAFVVQYNLTPIIERVDAWEGCVGMRFSGTAGAKAESLRVNRTLASTGPGQEYVQYLVDGSRNTGGFAGANASLYLKDGATYAGPGTTTNLELLRITSPYSDTFIADLEGGSGKCATITGNAGATDNDAYKASNEDVEIDHLVCDQVTDGVAIANTNPYGNITVRNSYLALGPTLAGAQAAFSLNNSRGAVNILNNQGLGWYNSLHGTGATDGSGNAHGTGVGIVLTGSTAVRSHGNKLVGFARPVVLISNGSTPSNFNSFEDTIVTSGAYMILPAIYCSSCDHNRFAPIITGLAATGQPGVTLDSGSSYNTVERTMINPAVVTSKVSDSGTGNVLIGPAN